jgi:hypothetical protein
MSSSLGSNDLWTQVLATPNNAQLRAQYVSALFEEGDRRAEPFLVSAEIERRKQKLEHWRTKTLATHYEQLTRVAAEEFAGSLERWGAKLRYVFGWPSEITIESADFIRHGAEIVATIPLRHLNLLSIDAAPEVFNLPEFNQIVSLQASGQVWSNKPILTLTASPYLDALRWLNLSKTGLSDPQVEKLAAAGNLRNLAQIDLTNNNNCRDPVDAAAGAGYDGNTGRLVLESVFLPPFGLELESKYGKIPWLNVLLHYGDFPLDRYRF